MDTKGNLLDQQPAYDKLFNTKVNIQNGDRVQHGKVVGRSSDPEGNLVGHYHDNPMLNTYSYDVEFSDGLVREYAANIIAENMVSQVDEEGYSLIMLDSIIDYKRDPAVVLSNDDGYVVTRRGVKRRRKTTAGWKILI